MILIEGPDKAGKTTLAKKIAELCGGEYYHFGVPPPGSYHLGMCREQLQDGADNLVFDRFGLSAFAYDFCLRANPNRSDAMTDIPDLIDLCNEVQEKDHLWIWADCPEETLIDRLNREGDSNGYIVERELRHICHTYHLLFSTIVENSDATILTYDSMHDVDDWVKNHAYQLRKYLGHERP